MGLTDKQKNILLKDGLPESVIEKMSYQEASERIGFILSHGKEKIQSQFIKTLPSKEVVTVEKPGFRREYVKDVNPFYVSYAKDLAIAMINAVIEQNKMSDLEHQKEVNATEIMDLAILMVGAARSRLR